MGSLNVMPSYKKYFPLTTATTSLNTSLAYVGGCVCALFGGFFVDWRGRRECVLSSALITLVGGVIQGAAVNVGMFVSSQPTQFS
jgi:MFS family permease